MKTVAIGSGVVLALLLFPSFSWAAKKTQEPPNLTGIWELDEGRSENPVEKMQEKLEEQRGSSRRGFGESGHRGGSGGRSGRQNPDGEGRGNRTKDNPVAAIESRLAFLNDGVDRITIAQENPRLSMTYSTARTRLLYTDGRKLEDTDSDGEVKTQSEWKRNNRLVVERDSDRGSVVEVYELEDEGKTLLVATKLKKQSDRPSITFLRTYNLAEPQDVADAG